MVIDRRSFVKILAVSTLIPSFKIYPFSKTQKLGRLLLSTSNMKKIGGSDFHLYLIDLDTGLKSIIPTTSLLHSFEINPLYPNEIVAMGQWEKELFIFDLEAMKTKNVIRCDSPDEFFVGHGVFSPNGEHFYASVANYDHNEGNVGKGFINVYEVKSAKKIVTIPSGGFEPHSLLWFEPWKKLLILNPGIGPDPGKLKKKKKLIYDIFPSITILDVSSKELIKKVDLKSENLCFGHLSEYKEDFFLIGGKRTEKKLWRPVAYKLNRDLSLSSMKADEVNMVAPLLSPLIDKEGKYSVATAHTFDKVYFWDFKSGDLLKSIKAKSPTGVSMTLDNSHFVVATMDNISLFDYKNLELKKTIPLGPHSPQGHSRII